MVMAYLKRFAETIIVGIIASLPVYIFINITGFFIDEWHSLFLNLISATLFLILHIFVFRKCAFEILDIIDYTKVNFLVTGILFVLNILCIFLNNKENMLMMLLFSYANVFSNVFGKFGCNIYVSQILSALLFWGIYIYEIMLFPKIYEKNIDILKEGMDYGIEDE